MVENCVCAPSKIRFDGEQKGIIAAANKMVKVVQFVPSSPPAHTREKAD
jgi:hypothetical protein